MIFVALFMYGSKELCAAGKKIAFCNLFGSLEDDHLIYPYNFFGGR